VCYSERMSVHPVPATLRREWAADLSTAQLYAVLRLRVEVFVVEQNCPYQELDGRDLEQSTRHFWVTGETDHPLAYLRLLEDPTEYRIGRVVTHPSIRGQGYSRRLMEAALADVGDAACVLESQVQAEGLYAAFGFVKSGEEYLEDGIPHIQMRRPAR
jgi:ElaA protein